MPSKTVSLQKRPSTRLLSHISLKDFGGPGLWVGDLDGDGKGEFIIAQMAAGYRDRDFARGLFWRAEWETVYCLTALRADGTVLWQQGSPWSGAYEYPSHGAIPIVVCDIDADGRAEVIELHDGRLRIIEGVSGADRAAITIEDPGVISVFSYFPRSGEPGIIVLKSEGDLAPDCSVSNQRLYAYDQTLRPVFGPLAARFAGHSVGFLPMENGECALLDGFCAIDRTGRKLWECDAPVVPAGSHVDSIAVGHMNGSGRSEVVYCLDGPNGTEFSMAALDGHGRFLWKVVGRHPQAVVIARAIESRQLPQIYMAEKSGGIGAYDPQGAVIWRRDDLNAYPVAVVRMPSGGESVLWAPHRSAQLCPYFTTGDGATIAAFDEVRRHRQQTRPLPYRHDGPGRPPLPLRRLHDFNIGYANLVRTFDVDGDGTDEIVIADRYDLWVYRVEWNS